jgi:hypothetical protein
MAEKSRVNEVAVRLEPPPEDPPAVVGLAAEVADDDAVVVGVAAVVGAVVEWLLLLQAPATRPDARASAVKARLFLTGGCSPYVRGRGWVSPDRLRPHV